MHIVDKNEKATLESKKTILLNLLMIWQKMLLLQTVGEESGSQPIVSLNEWGSNEKETNIIHRHVYGKSNEYGSKRKRELGKD